VDSPYAACCLVRRAAAGGAVGEAAGEAEEAETVSGSGRIIAGWTPPPVAPAPVTRLQPGKRRSAG
jgi:hypothetical protein